MARPAVLALAAAALLAPLLTTGCASEATDPAPLVAVVSAPPVTVQNVSYVTHAEVTPPRPEAPAIDHPTLSGCSARDPTCLYAACNGLDGHACEALGDWFADRRDLRAIPCFQKASALYADACEHHDEGACADTKRISAPGYKAHDYDAPPDEPPPTGTTVIVNGHHDTVNVYSRH